MGVRREYMFHTREEEARPVRMLMTSLVSLQRKRASRCDDLPD